MIGRLIGGVVDVAKSRSSRCEGDEVYVWDEAGTDGTRLDLDWEGGRVRGVTR